MESSCACVLSPSPWPRAFLSLALRGPVLDRAVLGLGLGFFFVSLALASSLASSTPPLLDNNVTRHYHIEKVRTNVVKGISAIAG